MSSTALPYNDEAEKRLLSILISPATDSAAYIDKLDAENRLFASDFYVEDNRKVFLAMKQLCNEGKTVDIATVGNALNFGASESGMRLLKYIASCETLKAAFDYYANIVKDLSRRRKYILAANKVIALAADTSTQTDEIGSEIQHVFDEDAETGIVSLKEIMLDVYGDIVSRYSSPGKLLGLPTEWTAINKLTGGLGKGELVVIGGRPGMGKSIAGQNLASYTANVTNKKVIFFSLEMPKNQLGARILSAAAWTRYERCRNGTVNSDDFYRLGIAMETIKSDNLLIDDTPRTDIEHIKSVCRAEKRRHKELGVVIIDYIGLIRLPPKCRTRWEGIGEITRELKLLAKELDCPVVALSQIGREVEKEKEKRPRLSDLRDSGCVEQDADIILLLYRDEYYYPHTQEKGIVEMTVAKCRDGSPGIARLSWQPQIMRIMDFADVKRIEKQNKKILMQKYGKQEILEKKAEQTDKTKEAKEA